MRLSGYFDGAPQKQRHHEGYYAERELTVHLFPPFQFTTLAVSEDKQQMPQATLKESSPQ
jgi:hypothetical protein